MYEIPVLREQLDHVAEERHHRQACSLPLKPSSACVRFSFRSSPPSVVGITSFLWQASIIHCRCRRLPIMYDFSVFVR